MKDKEEVEQAFDTPLGKEIEKLMGKLETLANRVFALQRRVNELESRVPF